MIEKRILLQISNTIIANLNNADGIGFLYGKIGLALFMYRYSRFVNNQFYENIADEIIDDIYNKMNDAIPRNYERGLAGIGCNVPNYKGKVRRRRSLRNFRRFRRAVVM